MSFFLSHREQRRGFGRRVRAASGGRRDERRARLRPKPACGARLRPEAGVWRTLSTEATRRRWLLQPRPGILVRVVSVVVVGLEHQRAPLDVLERVTILEHDLPKALAALRDRSNLLEVVVLSTCLRTEFYAVVERFHEGVADLQEHSGGVGRDDGRAAVRTADRSLRRRGGPCICSRSPPGCARRFPASTRFSVRSARPLSAPMPNGHREPCSEGCSRERSRPAAACGPRRRSGGEPRRLPTCRLTSQPNGCRGQVRLGEGGRGRSRPDEQERRGRAALAGGRRAPTCRWSTGPRASDSGGTDRRGEGTRARVAGRRARRGRLRDRHDRCTRSCRRPRDGVRRPYRLA